MHEFLDIHPDWETILRQHALDSIESVFACAKGDRLDKAGLENWRQRWRLDLAAADGARRVVYLKRFRSPPLRRQLQRWLEGSFLRSTARTEFLNAAALDRARLPGVKAVAVGEHMAGPFEKASFILLEEVQGESLERLAARLQAHGAAAPRVMIDAVAGLVTRFHQAGFVHRDLYLCHIFLRRPRAGESTSDYVLIDLQRVFRPRLRPRRWRVKDLAALAFSTPADVVGTRSRLRVLVQYARALRDDPRSLLARIGRRLKRLERRRRESAPPGGFPNDGSGMSREVAPAS